MMYNRVEFLCTALIKIFLIVLIIAIVAANNVSALTLDSSSGVWTSVTGGSGITGVNTNEVRWGIPAEFQKSGLRFDGVTSSQNIKTGNDFCLGKLTHFNYPIYSGTAASGAKLKITLHFSNPSITADFYYDLTIDETPNSGTCIQCIYKPCETPCPDKVSWSNTLSSQSFFINGEEYIVQIAGFVNQCPGGTPVSDFITQEKKKNEAYLVGRVLLKRPSISVVKTASLDGTCPGTDPVTAGIGATVTYCYQVQNTGDVTLTSVQLTDDKYGTITLDKTTLEPGETAKGTATHTVTPSDYPLLKNTATATGKTPKGSTISAIDDCVVNVVCTPLPVSVSPTSGELNCKVGSVELTASVSGGESPYSYQWYKDGSEISGATGSSYTATGAGTYKVVVTDNNGCTGTSSEVTITSVGNPSVTVSPTEGELNCNVNEVTLEATVSGGESPYSYQWYKDGSEISGATGSSYTATGAGTYKVVVTD
ncbi:MAG: PKD domain-containing protein, partial [Methanothrix sp.]|uniref:THxN family PEP-CTERM protein n=1 Tax=Methanothrix sp. TaxID=90426 RepID=UPI0019BBFE6D|nr:PKD domain-containing protein [Methanothrix sp.]